MNQLPAIPSRPLMAAERAGLIFINILDPEYVFSPPKTPARCTQQQGSQPSINSGVVCICLYVPALAELPPACPALYTGTHGIWDTYPASINIPHPPLAAPAA